MKLEQYGITLSRITSDDIELVRNMRNAPHVRSTMAYRRYITKSMQKKWFERVNNPLNYYLLISYRNEKIGVINIKNIRLDEKWGEGGIFIHEKNYWNTPVPVLASLCLLNFIFFQLKITDKSFIKILKDNLPSIRYNKILGYVLVPYQEKKKNQLYVLTKDAYIEKTEKLRKAATIFSGDTELPRLTGVKSPLNLEQMNIML
ncbi:MAG: GNAT family N-acetyltransferase [Bacteroidetes bacterium]|nr:GNAT family N-acetyltransferase [Bacteroidota bacterium]